MTAKESATGDSTEPTPSDTALLNWLEERRARARGAEMRATKIEFVVPYFMTIRQYIKGALFSEGDVPSSSSRTGR